MFKLARAAKLMFMAIILVHAIYNPFGFCLYDWAWRVLPQMNFNSHEFYLCAIATLFAIGAVMFFITTAFKGGIIGSICAVAIAIFLTRWAVFAFSLNVQNGSVQSFLVTVPLSLFLGWGMYKSHLVSRMSGRMPTN